MFLVSNSIFIITKDLVFIINYQTNFQKNHQQKDSNLLLQKTAIEKKMTVIRIFNSKSFTSKITKISIETMMLQSHSQSETLTHIHWHLFLYLHVSKVVIIMFLFHLVGRPAGYQLYRMTSSGPDPMMKTLMSDSHTCFVGCQNQHIAKRLDLP